jgi:hypothetical protein
MLSPSVFFLFSIWLIVASVDVKVYHYLSLEMGHPVSGFMDCGQSISCEWQSTTDIGQLKHHFTEHQKKFESTLTSNNHTNTVTLTVYNIHEWSSNKNFDRKKPALCYLPTNLTMGESEESYSNRPKNVESTFVNYDGYSTTSNSSSLQRSYKEAVRFNESSLMPSPIFSGMIKGNLRAVFPIIV